MPLNPPSYSGQDVWYSPDVFANKSQVALWQPPQPREPVNDPTLQAMIGGCEIGADGTAESQNQVSAYHQQLVQDGLITQDQLNQANSTKPSGAETANTSPAANPPAFANDTQGVENLTDFPLTLQLSRNFTLGQMTASPYVSFQHIVPASGWAGLTRGQLVANLKLLALNTLDPIRDRYPDSFLTCSWRPDNPTGTNQHPRGQACDLQFSRTPKSKYYEIAVWIKDNIPFDQLLLEYKNIRGPTCWIHISFKGSGNRPNGPYKIGTMLNDSFSGGSTTGLINLAPTIGLP